jgi:hypothetical protein
MTITYTIYINHSPLLWPIWPNMPKESQISKQSNHQNLSLVNPKLYNFTHANQEKFLPHQTPIWSNLIYIYIYIYIYISFISSL